MALASPFVFLSLVSLAASVVFRGQELKQFSDARSVSPALLRGSSSVPLLPPRVTPVTSFNHSLMMIMLHHASAVYTENADALRGWSCVRCRVPTIRRFQLTELMVEEKSLLQAYIGVQHNIRRIVIVFRGSRIGNLLNWILNLNFYELDLHYPGSETAMVHSGFYSGYHNTCLRPRLLEQLAKLRSLHPEYLVSVTGHSLGGALATLCALDLAINQAIFNVQLVTFGSPRVGNADFATLFHLFIPDTIRVTHSNDMVVHLPPMFVAKGRFSYRHVPTEVFLYHSTQIQSLTLEKICDDSGEDITCSISQPGNSIPDHLQYLNVPLMIGLRSEDELSPFQTAPEV